jgi:hypothetical protein
MRLTVCQVSRRISSQSNAIAQIPNKGVKSIIAASYTNNLAATIWKSRSEIDRHPHRVHDRGRPIALGREGCRCGCFAATNWTGPPFCCSCISSLLAAMGWPENAVSGRGTFVKMQANRKGFSQAHPQPPSRELEQAIETFA